MWNQPTPITLTDFALGEAVVRHEAGKRASERTNGRGTRERIRVSERKSLGREARSGGSHPLASPPLRDSGLVTTSGWYVEPKPYVSSRLTSLSPFPSCLSSLPKFYLSRSLPFTADQPREPHGSPLFVLFSPSFHPDPRDSHEYSSHDLLGRLGREESSLVYRPFSSPFSISSHSYPSYLIFVCSSRRFIVSCRFRSRRTRRKMETSIKPCVAVATLMWFIDDSEEKSRIFSNIIAIRR